MNDTVRAHCGQEHVKPPEGPESIQEALSAEAALLVEKDDGDVHERGYAHGIRREEEALCRVVDHREPDSREHEIAYGGHDVE